MSIYLSYLSIYLSEVIDCICTKATFKLHILSVSFYENFYNVIYTVLLEHIAICYLFFVFLENKHLKENLYYSFS